ncbi:MAG: T9SS type A sorting domain-containing protein [Bacteroidales bacterium]|nr:T9SS type A sorting domain-containing protein [Bacteroidales bacterium]
MKKIKLSYSNGVSTSRLSLMVLLPVQCFILFCLFFLASPGFMYAQITGDYRTNVSGKWDSVAIWQAYNGTSWVPASVAPNSADNNITILAGDSVFISSGKTIDQTVVEAGGVLCINPGITVNINNGTDDDLIINGKFYMLGNLSYSGTADETVVVNGMMTWHSDGTLAEITSRSITINLGATLIISGSGNKSFRYSGGFINNGGTTIWTGTGNIRGGSNTFTNLPDGIFIINNDQEVQYDGGGGSNINFVNRGTLEKQSGTGTTSFTGARFDNLGTVKIHTGTLRLNVSGVLYETFEIDTLCTLLFTGGTHDFKDYSLLTGKGEVRNTGATLNFTGTTAGTVLDTNCTFNFYNGNLGGSGKFTVYGTMNWQTDAGTSEITTMNTTISANAVLNIGGNGNKSFRYSGGSINNYGQVTWTGTGNIRGGSNFFNNMPGGVFNVLNDQEFQYDFGGGGGIKFNNSGTYRKIAGTGTTNYSNTTFNNSGTVEIHSGTLALSNGGTQTGIFDLSPSTTLLFSGGTHSIGDNALITGEGEAHVTSGTVNFTGTGTGAVADTSTTFNFTGGNMGGSGKFTVNGTMNWSAPSDNSTNFSTSTFTISTTGVLNIEGTFSRNFKGNLYNNGTVNWTGSGSIIGGSGSFNNQTSGVIYLQSDAGIYYDYGGAGRYTFVNDGLLDKTAGSGSSVLDYVTLTNNGTIRVDSGTINISGIFTNFSANNLSGGKYYLIGTLKFNDANVYNNYAHITLDGINSKMLNNTGNVDALQNFFTNNANGVFVLRNGRNFFTNAPYYYNYGIVDCDTNIFGGPGQFIHAAGALLIMGSPDGIALAGDSGNIQSIGLRSFSIMANYTYKGYEPQQSGDGLPVIAQNLTLDNKHGLTLVNSIALMDTLFMLDGNINTGGDTLELGTSTSVKGTLMRDTGTVIGTFQRWFDATVTNNNLFPIGTDSTYNPVNLSFTTAPATGGTVAASITGTDPGLKGLLITDGDTLSDVCEDGYWTMTAADNLSGGLYNIDITAAGFSAIDNIADMHLVKRNDPSNPWLAEGTHQAATGTPASPVAHRTGLNSFSDFGIALPRPFSHEAACDSFAAPNGLTYYESEVIRMHVPGTQVADSIIIIDLTVKKSTIGYVYLEGCYSISLNDQTFTESGTYYQTLVNLAGCDSVIIVAVIIDTVDVSTTISGFQITANQSGASYQWLDCDNNYAEIPGATQQNYTATANGNYAVEVYYNNCIDTSECVSIVNVGITENNLMNQIKIYPNPTVSNLFIEFPNQNCIEYDLELYSNIGDRLILMKGLHLNKFEMPLIRFRNGLYFIKITTSDGQSLVKKIIKE